MPVLMNKRGHNNILQNFKLSSALKLTGIITNEIYSITSTEDEQQGLRTGRLCVDAVFQ